MGVELLGEVEWWCEEHWASSPSITPSGRDPPMTTQACSLCNRPLSRIMVRGEWVYCDSCDRPLHEHVRPDDLLVRYKARRQASERLDD